MFFKLQTTVKSKDAKLNSLLGGTFKVKLKAIDLEEEFYWISYSSRPTIRCLLIRPQLLSPAWHLASSSSFFIPYSIPDISLTYSKPTVPHSCKFITSNHKSESSLEVHLSSQTAKALNQGFLAQLYTWPVILHNKSTTLLLNGWALSCTPNPLSLMTSLISH